MNQPWFIRSCNGEKIVLQAYQHQHEKIAMGLLSLIPDLKSLERLSTEMDHYHEEDSRKLFLWRDTETDHMVGLIGIELNDEVVLVRHISVNPSFRKEGIVKEMLHRLRMLYPKEAINGTLETAAIVTKWVQSIDEQKREGIQQH